MRPFGLHRRHLDINRTEFSIEFQPSWQDFLMGLLHTYYCIYVLFINHFVCEKFSNGYFRQKLYLYSIPLFVLHVWLHVLANSSYYTASTKIEYSISQTC